MATYVFENVDNNLFQQFKKFADNLGVGFKVIEKPKLVELKTQINQPVVKSNEPPSDDIMAYAGIFRGAWGDTPEQIEETIQGLKSEWEH